MKKITQLFVFLSLISYANTYSMEQGWLNRTTSNFTHRMLNTTTYPYLFSEHIVSLACIFAMPQPIGQYILYKQRSNMKKFLKQNEADKLEAVRKHYDIDPEVWQEAMQKMQAEHVFNLKALREPGNNYNTYHNPNLPEKWNAAINNECKRHGINKNNLNLKFCGTSDEALASAITYSPSSERNYNPGDIILYDSLIPPVELVPLDHTGAHEMTHVTEGHSLYTDAIINVIAPPLAIKTTSAVITTSDAPYWYEYYFFPARAKEKEFKKRINELEKTINELKETADEGEKRLKILQNLSQLPVYKEYRAAQEKTADTLVCCDDPIITADYMHKQNILYDYECAAYPANINDISVLDANWKTAHAIEYSRELYQKVIQQPKNFRAKLTHKAHAMRSGLRELRN